MKNPSTLLVAAFALVLTPQLARCASPAEPLARAGAALTAAFDPAHQTWTDVLARHVKAGGFDYAALKKDRQKLDAYVAQLEAVEPAEFAGWDKPHKFTFWVNAYNAYTVRRVVDAYPIKSIRDLGDEKLSVWDRELLPLGRLAPELRKTKLTLNDVENKILRPKFQDARVHAAINCASMGCPPLRAEAFTAAKLEAQLDEQVKAWLADTSRNRFDRAAAKIEISKVFEWFAEDFQKDAAGITAWIAKHRPADREWLVAAQKPEIAYIEYDWALNEAAR